LQNQLLCLVGDLEISGPRCSPASLASSRPLSILVYVMHFTSINTTAFILPSRLIAVYFQVSNVSNQCKPPISDCQHHPS
jgi:hypothetical protein